MAQRGTISLDQIRGAPGGGFPQSLAATGGKFIEAFDATTGLFTARVPTEADLSLSDITTNNVSTSKHGLAPKLPNDATKYLDGTGAYSVPSGGGGGGGLVLLEQHTASSSASLDFTTCISSSYDDYLIRFINIIPQTSGANWQMRMSTDGGISYDSGGNYGHAQYGFVSGAAGATGGNSATQLVITPGVGNTSNWGFNGQLSLFDPGGSGFTFIMAQESFRSSVNSALEGETSAGVYAVTTAVNAFRFMFSSGNITSGTIRCYGIAKS